MAFYTCFAKLKPACSDHRRSMASLPVPIAPLGSLGIWLVATGHRKEDDTVEMTVDLLEQFQKELQYVNTVSEDMLSGKNPGAGS
jgi:hypothetical protein